MKREITHQIPVLIVFLLSALCLAMANELSDALRFDRQLIHSGEFWRVVTSNFIHTNWPHLLMNSIGFFLILEIFRYSVSEVWIHFFCWGAVILNTSFLFLWSPDMHFYVGFSGALHGVVFSLCIASIGKYTLISCIILVGLCSKLFFEQINGGSDYISRLIDANVAIDAHLWGALSGLLLGLVYLLCKKR